MAIGGTNWAGNYAYQATRFEEPSTIDELRSVVANAARTGKVHALGTRHCFNQIADSETLVSLAKLDPDIVLDPEAHTVTVSGGVRYGELALALEAAGYALHNMASLPHISVAGSTATATHGSGDSNGNLATAVRAVELVTAGGELLTFTPDDPEFPGVVVNVGALGIVTRLTLEVEPTYLMIQEVFEHLPWDVLFEQFDEITTAARSVSLFHDFGETVGSVWLKTRVRAGDAPVARSDFLGAPASRTQRHPMEGLPGETCTRQLGEPGPWLHRLPHFRLEEIPASGHEIQAEYMIDRQHALDVFRVLRELHDTIRPHLLVSEFRTVRADDLWLSSAYGVETVCFHFSLHADQAAVNALLPVIEAALEPFRPRPHWGKYFFTGAAGLASRYPKMDDFRALAARLDPRGAFRNDFLDRHVFG